MNVLFITAVCGGLVHAEISGPVNEVPPAAQNVAECLQLDDHIELQTIATTDYERRMIGGQATILVNGHVDGQSSQVKGEAFRDLWQMDLQYSRNGGTAAAGFPVPGLLEWNVIGTNCWASAGPMRWDVAMYPAGDSDLDGVFDSGDLVAVFTAGRYGKVADWSAGDWNADRRFDSADLVAAFQEGSYAASSATAIPEPSSLALLLIGVLTWSKLRRK